MRIFLNSFLALFLLAVGSNAAAQEKGAVREGFSASNLVGVKIVLLRPSVWVGEQSMGGLPEPNADWSSEARRLLEAELVRRQADFSVEVVPEPELLGDAARDLAEHKALFNSVAGSVMNYQFFAGNRLPTRKHGPFDWTLGAGVGRIAEVTGARYAMFIRVDDQYGSTGRKIFQFMAAGLVGVGVKSGQHIGIAGLVDLHSGNLVWLNADGAMGGDVRTEEGMIKRVGQLLEDFPGLKTAVVPK